MMKIAWTYLIKKLFMEILNFLHLFWMARKKEIIFFDMPGSKTFICDLETFFTD